MTERTDGVRGRGYLNGILTVIAGLLVVIVLQWGAGGFASEAVAGREEVVQEEGIGLPNAAAQRRDILRAVEKMDSRLQRVEKAIGGTLKVEVVSMPAVEVREN